MGSVEATLDARWPRWQAASSLSAAGESLEEGLQDPRGQEAVEPLGLDLCSRQSQHLLQLGRQTRDRMRRETGFELAVQDVAHAAGTIDTDDRRPTGQRFEQD